MPNLLRILPVSMAFAGLSSLALAQTGPQLTVGPGVIYTVASRTTVNLSTASFNGVAYHSNSRQGILYVSDAHSEGSISLANVYAVDLETGRVTRVAGTVPDHTNGNIADCTPTGSPVQASCPGDGGPATSAPLHEPAGLALDNAGNLFIADDRQNVIRRVDANTGIITTIAGTGAPGPGGDGGPARQASLSSPIGIALDSSNNLYIADALNNRIRVINASSQQITTVAGTGTAGFGGDGGPAINAQLNRPLGVAVDRSGNVFIADSVNNAIREVAGGNIQTVAGQGGAAGYSGDGGAATAATLQYPYSVAVDAGGNLYIADDNNNVIRKVTGDATHIISTIAGQGPTSGGYSGDGGAAIKAALHNPTGIVTDGQGSLFFADNQFGAVRRITATAAPLTLPLTGSSSSSAFPLTVSNTGDQTLNISSVTFPSNFTAGSGGTCSAGAISLAPGASCTLPVNFTAGGSTSGTLTFTSNTGNQSGATTNVTLSESNGLYFVPVPPCRVIDTRYSDPNGFGAPIFSAGETRNYAIRYSIGLGCAGSYIPANANVQAYSLNVTVVPPGSLTYLTVFPSGISRPNVSTLNSFDGRIKANAAIVPANTGDTNRGISIYASDSTHVVVDINGYYVPESDPASNNNNQTPLAYYPLPPCRSVDTRTGSGLLGSGTPLLGGTTTNYTLAGTCGLPASAQAYALNYTALPRNGSLFYLTTWPTGGTRPVVSTINATTGAVTANAAVVPAPSSANGSVSVFATDDTDLLIDVAGYYATPSANGLALYNLTPCRVYDTRTIGSGGPLNGNAVVNEYVGNGCSAAATAQSYVLNTTVLPYQGHGLEYLTVWGQGSGQPLQSVLNAFDGAVTSNLAVVPTVNGYISTYVTEPTGLILDLSAYFAP